MSHKKLRADKHCLNCGHEVPERYCPHCGQENLQWKDSAWIMLVDYFKDSFNYDSRLWHTLRTLVLRPGQVASEYLNGKRRQNLEPIRFYIFASSAFFLLLFLEVGSLTLTAGQDQLSTSRRLYHLQREKDLLKGSPDTVHINQLIQGLQQHREHEVRNDSTQRDFELELFDSGEDTTTTESPLGQFLLNRLRQRQKDLEREHEGDEQSALSAFGDELLHALPQLFFLSLPFFAFFLKILYWRRRPNLYVDHFIFSMYHYAYLFVIQSLVVLGIGLTQYVDMSWAASLSGYIITALIAYPFIYLLLSMKRFYQDTWIKLCIRYGLLMVLFFFTIIFLFLFLAAFTLLW